MKNLLLTLVSIVVLAGNSVAAAPALSKDALQDIARHRAMAQAHEAAAQCLESGKPDEACEKALALACKGLAIGKFCGMKHEH